MFFKNQYYCHKLCSQNSNEIQNHFNNDFSFVNKSLIYLITESVAEYPYPYLTEKTWKAMFYQTPFMIVGPKHSLHLLQSFGFQTFLQSFFRQLVQCTVVTHCTICVHL